MCESLGLTLVLPRAPDLHHHSLDSAYSSPQHLLEEQGRAVSAPSNTLSRTSKQIKMERERLRQQRLLAREPRLAPGLLPTVLVEADRNKFFDSARERFQSSNSEGLAGFLAEREEQFAGRRAGAFPPQLWEGRAVSGGPPWGEGGPASNTHSEGKSEGEVGVRVIPITISDLPASPLSSPPALTPEPGDKPEERIIPVMIQTSPSETTPVRAPPLPALMGDLRIGDSLLRYQTLLLKLCTAYPPLVSLKLPSFLEPWITVSCSNKL